MPTQLYLFPRPFRRRAFGIHRIISRELISSNGSFCTRNHLTRLTSISTVRKMSSAPAAEGKRKADRPISPPPVKRKAQSSITKGAVASFFTPASQKPKDEKRTLWTERAPNEDTPGTLLVGRYEPATNGAATKEENGNERLKRRKIAAFDLDSTLITTASGKKHGDDPADWKWWDASVPARLRRMYSEEGYRVVILSNQAGLTLHADPKAKASSKAPKNLGKDRVAKFKQKCAAVLAALDIPTSVYAATARDAYRKPRTGMWDEVCDDYDIPAEEVDLENSVFVGDAGGRTAAAKGEGETGGKRAGAKKAGVPKDFSCSDRNFAHNVGIPYFTPEEFFLDEAPREFVRDFDLAAYPFSEKGAESQLPPPPSETVRTDGGDGDGEGVADPKKDVKSPGPHDDVGFARTNPQELVLFVGPPGAGKSTFFRRRLAGLGYERVNQDALGSRARCLRAAAEMLERGASVAVDNTNPDPAGRREWVALARDRFQVPVRCLWFRTPPAVCLHNDAVRAMNREMNPESRAALPQLAFNSYFARLTAPDAAAEGFQDVIEVGFRFRGSRDEYAVWGRYWA